MRLTLREAPLAVELAQVAVKKTRELLANGNNNPYLLVPGSHFRSPHVEAVHDLLGQARSVPNIQSLQSVVDPFRYTLCEAKIAMGAKTGNCGEHASVAFAHFFIWGHYPIAKCAFPDAWDHAFVLVGDLGQPLAICDAWANIACPYDRWNEWKQHIWGAPGPPDDAMRVVTSITRDAGSVAAYKLLTAGQGTIKGMDVSF